MFNLIKKISKKFISKSLVIGDNIVEEFLNGKVYTAVLSNSASTNTLFTNAAEIIISPPTEIELLEKVKIKKDSDWIVACGGGKINDISKFLAKKYKKKLCIVPGVLSTTSWLNGAIALRKENVLCFAGEKWPNKVLFDTDFLMKSPFFLHLAGLADLMCCCSAIGDWKIASYRGKEKFSMKGYNAYIKYAKDIISEHPKFEHEDKEALMLILHYFLEGLALCGASMSGRPLEGSEHYIYYYLDEISKNSLIHGSVIAVTSLFCLKLQKENAAIDPETLKSFYKKLGFRMTYIQRFSPDFFKKIKYFIEERKLGYSILNELKENEYSIEKINDWLFS